MDRDKLTHLLQTMYRMSDEQLLEEFRIAEKEIERQGGPQSDPQGFERLLMKLESERRGEGVIQL